MQLEEKKVKSNFYFIYMNKFNSLSSVFLCKTQDRLLKLILKNGKHLTFHTVSVEETKTKIGSSTKTKYHVKTSVKNLCKTTTLKAERGLNN